MAAAQVVCATGVGSAEPRLVCQRTSRGLRLDCCNNEAFWLEVDMFDRKARGRIAHCPYAQQKSFMMDVIGSRIKITHPACASFYIELVELQM